MLASLVAGAVRRSLAGEPPAPLLPEILETKLFTGQGSAWITFDQAPGPDETVVIFFVGNDSPTTGTISNVADSRTIRLPASRGDTLAIRVGFTQGNGLTTSFGQTMPGTARSIMVGYRIANADYSQRKATAFTVGSGTAQSVFTVTDGPDIPDNHWLSLGFACSTEGLPTDVSQTPGLIPFDSILDSPVYLGRGSAIHDSSITEQTISASWSPTSNAGVMVISLPSLPPT